MPSIFYASPVWSGIALKSPIRLLDKNIRRILRNITTIPKKAGNEALYLATKESPLEEKMKEIAKIFFEKTTNSCINDIATLGEANLNTWDRYRRPVSSTGITRHQPPKRVR